MKAIRFFSVAFLLLGSLVFNPANVAAQDDIVALDTINFQNGVEKYIGAEVPGAGKAVFFDGVGFAAPEGLEFTQASYTFAQGTSFYVSNVAFNATADTISLRINFLISESVPFGDVLDTLTISAKGANSFVLPLKGSSVQFVAGPSSVHFDPVLVGDAAPLARQVTITTVIQTLAGFTYSIAGGAGSAFTVAKIGENPGQVSTVTLGVSFAPTSVEDYSDTLVISHRAYPNLVSKIPVSGSGVDIRTIPYQTLSFGTVVDSTVTKPLIVDSKLLVEDVAIADTEYFSFTYGPDWNVYGGTLYVSFTPDTVRNYFHGDLIIVATGADTLHVSLSGTGQKQPEISSDPAEYYFGEVPVGSTGLSDPITVVLTNPESWLTDPGTFSLEDDNGIFRVETVQQGPSLRPDIVYVTLSFTPDAAGGFENELIVKALYADDYSIPLTGTGTIYAQSPQQATAIAGTEAAATAVSVKEGSIVVSHAPVGSSIRVYNLTGQALKTQPVASDTEVLQTASLPRSVYVVVVNDRNQEILRRKVIL